MICYILETIAAIAGLVGFYGGTQSLTIFCGVFIVLLNLKAILQGTLNPFTMILAGVIGWLIVKDFFSGFAIGLCYESAVTGLLGLFSRKE